MHRESRRGLYCMLLINVMYVNHLGETIRLLFKVAQVPFEDIRLDEEGILRLADGQDSKIGTMTEKYSSRRLTIWLNCKLSNGILFVTFRISQVFPAHPPCGRPDHAEVRGLGKWDFSLSLPRPEVWPHWIHGIWCCPLWQGEVGDSTGFIIMYLP